MKVFVYQSKKIKNIESELTHLQEVGISYQVVNDWQKVESYNGFDAIVVLGGDGTVLRCVTTAVEYDLPILAINMGNLGFLTAFERDKIGDAVYALKNGKLMEDSRMTIIAEGKDFHCVGLNDVVFERGKKKDSQVVTLEMSYKDHKIDVLTGNGLVVSTPTGSTAYSLSAGGSIMDPLQECIMLTPLCAHSLHARPIIMNGEREVEVKNMSSDTCVVTIDGINKYKIASYEVVKIRKHAKQVKFLKTQEDFFQKLFEKLSRWGR